MPIFDQGYQHWDGRLSGHLWRWLAVARHGVRGLLKSWIVRIMLLIAWLPAIALVTALTLWGLLEQQAESVIAFLQQILPADVVARPQDYRSAVWTIAYSYFFKTELVCSMFLVMVVGPNLVSRDLRFNALPLYFSRPVRRIDYFLGKLAVIGFFLAATVVLPAAGAYLLGVAFSLDLGVVRDTSRLLGAGVLYGLLITVTSGTLMLALSSLFRRSIYVGLAWAGFIFLTFMLSSALTGIKGDGERREIVDTGLEQWVAANPPPPGVEMRGNYPRFRYRPPSGQKDDKDQPKKSAEERARERWLRQWSAEFADLTRKAEDARLAQAESDWRPVLSYGSNLDRLGDLLLDTDGAWHLIGKTIERPRAAVGPLAKSKGLPVSTGPADDRRLARQRTWQFPWYWSAGALAGLWLVSVFVLTRRVKSLDRLK